jgi:hypothetical protein
MSRAAVLFSGLLTVRPRWLLPEKDVDMPIDVASFNKGDQVYLAKGSYQGTVGTFLNLRTDPKWADIQEPNNFVRAHPVEWMALVTPPRAPK